MQNAPKVSWRAHKRMGEQARLQHLQNSQLYPKSRSFSATFNEFATESASKIAALKWLK
jgi:hypothetical protein